MSHENSKYAIKRLLHCLSQLLAEADDNPFVEIIDSSNRMSAGDRDILDLAKL